MELSGHRACEDTQAAVVPAADSNEHAIRRLYCKKVEHERELVKMIRNNLTIDRAVKESVKARLRVLVRRILNKYGYPPDKQEKATQTVLEQAELLCD